MNRWWICLRVGVGGVLLAALAVPAAACPWHQSLLRFGKWAPLLERALTETHAEQDLDLAELAPADPEGRDALRVEVQAPLGEVGQWLPPQVWPVIAIHAAMLPNGEVLHYSYPSAGPGSAAMTWNPVTGQFADHSLDTDIFCSGLVLLEDGRLYVTGGNDYECTFQGRQITHAYDPFSGEWEVLGDMEVGRWYPSNIKQGDGSVLILSGLDRTCNLTPVMERFTPGLGLERVPAGDRFVELYPRLHLLSDGRVAHVGPEQSTFVWNPASQQWTFVDNMNNGFRWDGTSVLLPGRQDTVLAIGGAVSATAEIIDFGAAQPQWQFTGSMSFARSHANAVVLPDRNVLIVGGGQNGLYGSPILNAELYDPDSGGWTLLPSQAFGRMYHSTTVLLPDGRVLSAGQDSGVSALRGEIYEPAYLFRGPRPVITLAPTDVAFGEGFTVSSPEADEISSVALISLTTVTHSVNTGQRYVGLAFTHAGGDQLQVTAPAHGDLAPPGYYMLFVVNGDEVPSVAPIVHLGASDPDFIFGDGFESGTTAAWSQTAGNVTVVQPGLGGTGNALEATVDGTALPSFVESDHPQGETSFSASFLLDANNVQLGGSVDLLTLIGNGVHGRLSLQQRGGNYRVSLLVRTDAGASVLVGRAAVPAQGEVALQVDVVAGAGNGVARLWLDGGLVGEATGLDNDQRLVERVRLGLPTGSAGAAGGSGSVRLDEYLSRR